MKNTLPCDTRIACRGPLVITHKEGRCNYHVPGSVPVRTIAPKGMCHVAYHALLPHALGVLYSGTVAVEADCPSPENPVRFRIEATVLPIQFRLLNILKRLVHRFLFPLALFERGVTMTVVSEGPCPRAMRVGKEFSLNIGNVQLTNDVILPFGSPEDICPAAAAALYPFMAHSRPDTRISVFCPDHRARMEFIT